MRNVQLWDQYTGFVISFLFKGLLIVNQTSIQHKRSVGASSPFIVQHMHVFSQLNYCSGSIEAWKKACTSILNVENPVEPWFLQRYLEFTEELNSVGKQKRFCCPLRLDCLIAKTSLAKNQGSEKFQLKSLGLTVAFFFSFSKKQKPTSLSDDIHASCSGLIRRLLW